MTTSTYHTGVKYAEDVVSGKIIAGKFVSAACQRFLDDLERDDWRWNFSISHANHILEFMENMIHHVTGPLAGKKLKLEPWQSFALINIFGWLDDSGIRRFQYVIMLVARKNGKSLFASSLAIYEMIFGEEGGQIYSLATKMEQAKIAFDAAVRIVEKAAPQVRDRFKHRTNNLSNISNWSVYKPLGRESKSLDGLNPSLNVFDEAAAYSDRNLVEVMTSATGARDNFLHLFITTAQFSKQTVFYENMSYMEKILHKKFDDERWFGLLYSLDEGDDWQDENVWIKANPNLDVSLKRDYLHGEVKQAKEMKSKRNGVLVKHFNIFTKTSEAWIDTKYWKASTVGELSRKGEMFMGMDLSKTRDLTSVVRLWVNGDHFEADFKCFLPKSAMSLVPHAYEPLYRQAIDDNLLFLTDTKTVDYNIVKQYILNSRDQYDFKALAYDPWNSSMLITELEDDNVTLLEVGQGQRHMSPAAKQTERLILDGLISHTGHPFIEWQLENAESYTDLNENLKVRKGEDNNLKIDSIISLIMCVSLAAGKLDKPKAFSFASRSVIME